jgi:CBS domain-containing protein
MTERVRQAMTPAPATIGADEYVVEAARLMATHDVGSLPVVDDGKLVGIVTDRDVVLQVVAKDLDPHKTPVSTVCSENPIVVGPDDSLDEALQRMAREQVRRLPVVEESKVVGILAQADVSRAAEPEATGKMVEEISESGS